MNLGQVFTWAAFLSALAAGLAFLGAMVGREGAWRFGVRAFWLQWAALVASMVFLWHILFNHLY